MTWVIWGYPYFQKASTLHTTKVPTYPSGQIGAFMARKSGGKGDSTGNQMGWFRGQFIGNIDDFNVRIVEACWRFFVKALEQVACFL